jgi:cytochrome P450
MHEGTAAAHFNRQIFWPFALLLSLPDWLGTTIAPGLSLYIAFIRDCERQIKAIIDGSNTGDEKTSHLTIFHELLQGNLPPQEKTISRLVQEGQIIVSAGTETTAWCLSVMTYHLLANPAILERLREELYTAMPDPDKVVPLEKLEQLPFLTACIQEGLRLSYGLTTRLARISPDEVMVFNDGKKDWHIPPGVSYQLI